MRLLKKNLFCINPTLHYFLKNSDPASVDDIGPVLIHSLASIYKEKSVFAKMSCIMESASAFLAAVVYGGRDLNDHSLQDTYL